MINVTGVKISLEFFPLLLSRPDPYCKSSSLSKHLLLGVVKQLLGRVDLASLPTEIKQPKASSPL